jgi:hypothetical protein
MLHFIYLYKISDKKISSRKKYMRIKFFIFILLLYVNRIFFLKNMTLQIYKMDYYVY